MPKKTPVTEFVDTILDYLRPIILESEEARLWHTDRERRMYFDGFDQCAQATRDAIIRAAEDTLFRDLVEDGTIKRHRTPPNP